MDIPHLISIVGAGPGDPDLLTVKGMRRLQNADVVLYDALVGDEMLEFTKAGTVKKYVGKLCDDGQNPKTRQDGIHNEFLYWAANGKKVVRLKSGDPMIFGRGAEEIRFCKENELNYEVIPGVTAAVAGSSLFSIPLTERCKNNMVLFSCGRVGENGIPGVETVLNVLTQGCPVVLYMGLNNLLHYSKELLKNGVSGAVPVQILSKISRDDQQQYSTTVGQIREFLKENRPETPSTIIIGEHAQPIEGNLKAEQLEKLLSI